MRPPKKDGQATTVFFHVTVMGLDSIDETSMVSVERLKHFTTLYNILIILDLRRWHFLRTNMERSSIETSWKHDVRISPSGSRVAQEYVEARFFLQERQVSYISDNDDPKPLHVALQGQNHSLHGEADAEVVLRYELHHLPSRHSRMQTSNGKLYVEVLRQKFKKV